MIRFNDQVIIRVGDHIIVTHNYITSEFASFFKQLVERGTAYASAYTNTGTVIIPSGIVVQLLNGNNVVAVLQANIVKYNINSVLYNASDHSNATYTFNNVVLTAVDKNGVLLYPIAFVNLKNAVTKSSGSFVDLSWLISWTLSNNLTNLNIPLPSKIPFNISPTYTVRYFQCNTSTVAVLLLLFLGVTPTDNCLYQTLQNLNISNIKGIVLILLFDINGNVVGIGSTNPANITPSGTPVKMACYIGIDNSVVPFAYGDIQGEIIQGEEQYGLDLEFQGNIAQLYTPPPGYYSV